MENLSSESFINRDNKYDEKKEKNKKGNKEKYKKKKKEEYERNDEDEDEDLLEEDEDKETIIKKISPIKTQTSGAIGETEEEKKLKEKYLKHYTKKEIIIKSLKFAFGNWRFNVYNQINSLIDQGFSIYMPIYHSRIVNAITKDKNLDILYSSFLAYIILISVRLITSELMQCLAYYFVRDSLYSYRNIVMENISQKDVEFFDIIKSGELIERIRQNESTIEKNFLFKTLNFIFTLAKITYLGYYIFRYSFDLSLIYLIIYGFNFLIDYLLKKQFESSNDRKRFRLRDNYSSCLNEFISNIRLIKSFGTEESEIQKLQTLKLRSSRPFGGWQNFLRSLNSFGKKFGDIYIYYLAGKKTLLGQMNYGDLIVFQSYSNQLKKTFSTIKSLFDEYLEMFESWRRFFEIYDYLPKIISEKNIIPKEIEGSLTFDKVSFSYPLKPEVKVLKDLSFKIPAGKVFAIVGYSGSGKTTISNLIQRFYDPNIGNIFIDEYNIKDLNLNWLHHQIGFVAQEPVLYSGTIEDNITYGVNEYTQEHFNKVCEMSNINKFINDKSLFPNGLKTLVGEKGSKVSGGQKQRIAIARALMKNVKFLVFDEATSALDAESEHDVQMAIDNIIKKKNITTVIIAHRLSTIKNCDVILFLDKGNIVEMGSHDELIEKNGEYKKLVQKQLVS